LQRFSRRKNGSEQILIEYAAIAAADRKLDRSRRHSRASAAKSLRCGTKASALICSALSRLAHFFRSHSLRRYLHIEAVFVLCRVLDHVSVAPVVESALQLPALK
jgi:hypothetical protein